MLLCSCSSCLFLLVLFFYFFPSPQRSELEELLLSTTFSSFALLEAVGRSMDAAAQQSKANRGEKPDRPMERLIKKATFKNEVQWMVREAYKNSDKNDDNQLNFNEFFAWVSTTPQVMEVLYGTFQLRNEAVAATTTSKSTSIRTPSAITTTERSNSLFRGSGRVSPDPLSSESTLTLKLESTTTIDSKKEVGSKEVGSKEESKENDDEDSKTKLIQHQTQSAKLRAVWRYWGNITFFISMLGITFMVCERLTLHYYYDDKPNAFTSTFRYIVSVDCLLLAIALICWKQSSVMLMRSQGHVNPMATICSTPFVRNSLLFEIFIALIHVPPHVMEELSDYRGLQYWLTNLLSWSMLLRLHLLPTMLQQYFLQKYVTIRTEFLAKLSNVQFHVMFTLRAELRIQPFRLVIVALFITLVVITFLLEEAELGLDCLTTWENVTTTSTSGQNMTQNMTMLTMIKVHAGGIGGAGDTKDFHWLYEGNCHPESNIPGVGWFYYSLNLALALAPRRIPMTPAGQSFNILGGLVSLSIFAVTVAAVQEALKPTLSEQRVLQGA